MKLKQLQQAMTRSTCVNRCETSYSNNCVGVLALPLFLLERFFPLRKNTRSFLARLAINGAISALTFVAAIGLVQPAARWSLRWSAEKPFDLVHLAVLPAWTESALKHKHRDRSNIAGCLMSLP